MAELDGPAVPEGREPAAVEGQLSDSWLATHALPLMEPPAHLALERYGVTWDGSPDKPLLTRMADGYWTPWHVAADLLKRLALRPIPVTERLPGPEDCAPHPRTKRGNWCWGFERCEVPLARPARWRLMHMEAVEMEASHWLPAHALPLPEVE